MGMRNWNSRLNEVNERRPIVSGLVLGAAAYPVILLVVGWGPGNAFVDAFWWSLAVAVFPAIGGAIRRDLKKGGSSSPTGIGKQPSDDEAPLR